MQRRPLGMPMWLSSCTIHYLHTVINSPRSMHDARCIHTTTGTPTRDGGVRHGVRPSPTPSKPSTFISRSNPPMGHISTPQLAAALSASSRSPREHFPPCGGGYMGFRSSRPRAAMRVNQPSFSCDVGGVGGGGATFSTSRWAMVILWTVFAAAT